MLGYRQPDLLEDQMVQELDILRCANILLKNYGVSDATYRAALRADACLDQGDADGQRVWLRVISAIKEMARTDKAPSELLH